MGNKQQKRVNRPFCMSEWEFVGCTNGCGLFRNRTTSQHCQEYLLKVEIEKDKLIYQKRRSRVEQHLVNILHCEVFTNFDERYTLINYTVRVFMERIPVRLQEIAQLPADTIPLLIFECLLGFKKIYQEYQPVKIRADMIGFNEQKQLRVWLSHNFLENFAHTGNIVTNEATMVSDIFNIFDAYSDLYSNRPEMTTFTQGLQFIAQLRTPNKSSLTLIKVFESPIANKPLALKELQSIKYVGSRQRNDISPQNKRQQTKMIDITTSGGTRARIEAEDPSEPYHLVVQSAKKLKQTTPIKMESVGVPFLNQRIHQRQVSITNHNPKPTSSTALDADIKKNVTITNTNNITKLNNQKSGLMIGIETARTTSNNMSVYNNLVEIDNNRLQLELLDDKKTKESKLHLIKDVLVDNQTDQTVKKICKIYDYAIKFDPFMYHQLQKVKGRISKISNQYLIRKLIEVSEQETESASKVPHSQSDPHWHKLKSELPPIITSLTKLESEERIKRILMEERIKRGENYEPYKSNMNMSFFGSPAQSNKIIRKTTLDSNTKLPFARSSQLSVRPETIPQIVSQMRATTSEASQVSSHEHKQTQKCKAMKTFKQQVQKLLEF